LVQLCQFGDQLLFALIWITQLATPTRMLRTIKW
jgi:hypothetical protein